MTTATAARSVSLYALRITLDPAGEFPGSAEGDCYVSEQDEQIKLIVGRREARRAAEAILRGTNAHAIPVRVETARLTIDRDQINLA